MDFRCFLCTYEQAKNQLFANIRARLSLNYSSDTSCLVDPPPPLLLYTCACHVFDIVVKYSLTDISGIQYRVLNRKKGPAVWVRLLTS